MCHSSRPHPPAAPKPSFKNPPFSFWVFPAHGPPPSPPSLFLPAVYSFADKMVHHGFTDPLRPPSIASRSAAGAAVILGGRNNAGVAGGVGRVPSVSLPPSPSPSRPSSPLFAAVLLRATGVKPAPAGGTPLAAAASAAVDTAAGVADASATAAAARRVVASACTALHGLLRPGSSGGSHGNGNGSRRGDSTTSAAIAAARAVAPCLQALLSLCWSKSRAAVTPSCVRPTERQRGAAAAAAGEDGRLQAERERQRGDPQEQAGGDDGQEEWGEAYRAASSLLDFVDGFLEVEEAGGRWARRRRGWSAAPARDRVGHPQPGGVVRPGSTDPRRSSMPSPEGEGGALTRMWAEVRGLCRREAEARAATSRRLASLLKESAAAAAAEALPGGGRGAVGGLDNSVGMVTLECVLYIHLCVVCV